MGCFRPAPSILTADIGHPVQHPPGVTSFLVPFHRGGDGGSETLSKFPKVAPPGSSWAPRLASPQSSGILFQGVGPGLSCPRVPGDPPGGSQPDLPAEWGGSTPSGPDVPLPLRLLPRPHQEWVTSTELLISLDRLNTFGDDIFKDPKVLQSYYYAVSDFSVGGR